MLECEVCKKVRTHSRTFTHFNIPLPFTSEEGLTPDDEIIPPVVYKTVAICSTCADIILARTE